MEVTRREIIASITIIALMLLLGFVISGKITDYELDKNQMYNTAVRIDNPELFTYAMSTNVGNAFVYGELKAIDTVTYPEIGSEYLYVKKVREEYRMHTRIVTHSDGKGHTTTTTQVYYTWDEISHESIHSERISFSGSEFKYSQIDTPGGSYITTKKESSDVRFKYYGTPTKMQGTIFAYLSENTIKDTAGFYQDKNIEQTVKDLTTNVLPILFWVFWIILTGVCVYGFYYLDNRWLEG